jgi:acetyl-CoA synthetase
VVCLPTGSTAPTAIRALQRFGDEHPRKHDLSSLRILGSVGEPINPEAWLWYYEGAPPLRARKPCFPPRRARSAAVGPVWRAAVVGNKRCSVVDTWWQTETGKPCVSTCTHAERPPQVVQPRSLALPRMMGDAAGPAQVVT